MQKYITQTTQSVVRRLLPEAQPSISNFFNLYNGYCVLTSLTCKLGAAFKQQFVEAVSCWTTLRILLSTLAEQVNKKS